MRYIKTLNGPPPSFIDWLKNNEQSIKNKLQDDNISGKDIWGFFKENGTVYNDLKKVLVEDQGFICCYCGQRIENNHHTSIEHLQPKSKFKNLTLDFDNLLASCKGGCENVVHIVNRSERLIDIAARYGVDVEHIEEVYVNVDEESLFRKKYDLENLSAGDRIVIFPRLETPEQHCDTRKGNKEINITPLQSDCGDKFSYDLLNGEILKTTENTNTVEILGLNANRYLNRLRKKTLDDAIFLKQQLIEDFGHSQQEFESNRLVLIDNISKLNASNPILTPFIFVTIWSLNN